MITCTKCKCWLENEQFHWRNKRLGKRKSICKSCRKNSDKRYYKIHNTKRKLQVQQRIRRLRQWFALLKTDKVCGLCKENHIACLDFHHKDKTKKIMDLSDVVNAGWGEKKILLEIDKCDIICANCHRKLHWKERLKQNET